MGTHFSGLNLGIRRRRFLQLTAGTAAYLAFLRRAWPFSQSSEHDSTLWHDPAQYRHDRRSGT